MTDGRPHLAALFLDGMIVDVGMKDDILGDLEEEWCERASSQDVQHANRWYRTQVIRAFPPLLKAWWNHTPWYLLILVLPGALILRLVTGLLGAGTLLATGVVLHAAGVDRTTATIAAAAGSAAWGFLGGVLMVTVHRKAPTPGFCWFLFLAFLTTATFREPVTSGQLESWYPLMEKLLLLPAVVAGGFFEMRRRFVLQQRRVTS